MFAVIKTGGKQYRVAAEDILKIERIAGEAGDVVQIGDVLMVGTGADADIGLPFVEGASVAAEIIEQMRGPKVISFKKRRRQNSQRTRGHRQLLTTVRISEILTDGKKPSKAAKAKPSAAKKKDDAPAKASADSDDQGMSTGTKAAVAAAGVAATAVAAGAVAATVASGDKDKKAAPAKTEAKAKPAAKAASEKAAPEKAATKKAAPKKADAKSGAKASKTLFTAPKGGKDDLKLIDGVGPVLEKKMNDLGVTQFEQIAAFKKADIDKLDDALDFKGRIERDDWVKQAKALAKEKKA